MTWFERPRKPAAPQPAAFGRVRTEAGVANVGWHQLGGAPKHVAGSPSVEREAPPEPPKLSPSQEPDALLSRQPAARPTNAVAPRSVAPADHELARARYEEATSRLEQAIVDLVDLKERILSHEQERMTELSMAIARRVVGRELRTDATLIAGLVVEGVVALGERDGVTVRLGPMSDEATDVALALALRTKLPKCEVIRDAELEAGDCVVETSLGRVDESLSARLAAAERALSGDDDAGA